MQSNNTKLIFALTITTVGMVVFAGLFFLSGNPKERQQTITQSSPLVVTNNFTNTVTQEVIKEIPKEIEKIVKVPAEIPAEYYTAMNLYAKMTNATAVNKSGILFNIHSVCPIYFLSDDVKQFVSLEAVKAKFELAMRRNNVPLSDKSQNYVLLSINGYFTDSDKILLLYTIESSVSERQWVFREGDCRMKDVTVWKTDGAYGSVGKNKANDFLLGLVEKQAEVFANDYLSANPK